MFLEAPRGVTWPRRRVRLGPTDRGEHARFRHLLRADEGADKGQIYDLEHRRVGSSHAGPERV